MSFYTNRRDKTVYPLLKKFGVLAKLVSKDTLTFNSETGGTTVSSAGKEYPCYVLLDQYKKSEIDGSTILVGDVRFYVEATKLKISPTPEFKLLLGTEYFEIINVTPLKPGNVVVMWELQGRN